MWWSKYDAYMCAENGVFICRICVCMCMYDIGWGAGRQVCGCSHTLTGLHECCTMGSSGDAVLYHEVSKNTQLQTHPPPPPPPYTNTQRNTQHRHSEKAQADPPCALLPVTRTCFCGFYRQLHTNMSRIATLSASEH